MTIFQKSGIWQSFPPWEWPISLYFYYETWKKIRQLQESGNMGILIKGNKGILIKGNIGNSLLKYILTFCSCHLMFYICNSFNWIVVNFKLKGWFSQVYSLNVSRLLVHQINWIDLRSDFFVFITFTTDWDMQWQIVSGPTDCDRFCHFTNFIKINGINLQF